MNESLMLFAIGINKFTVNNWAEKKPKLLEMIKLSDDDVAFLDAKECKTDYFKYNTRPPYFDEFCNIMAEELDEIVEVFTEGLADRYRGEIASAKANVKVYLENPAGIGEHPDIAEAIESQIEKIAAAHEKIDVIEQYF